MQEYYTEAIVLDKENLGEADLLVSFYCMDLGKVAARATSARKILSKLNAHLEPLNLIKLRLVNKNSFQIIDALAINNFSHWRQPEKLLQAINLLQFIKQVTFEGEKDDQLWLTLKNTLASSVISYIPLLKILGFDPQFAVCEICQKKPDYFEIQDASFLCCRCHSYNNLCSNSYIPLF